MTAHTYRSSKPDRWVIPRQSADISTRGPILPMAEEKAGWADWSIRFYCVGIFLPAAAYAMGWLS